MSTFNGIVAEFPEIRIDFFRTQPDRQPPLACFLSHVHSDHLVGLETLRSPFVYCSAATRAILLRLERSQCRINYARGVLEARRQTYKHLSKVLKSLPIETPTSLELQPGHHIQVTLFDANHCPGAVMFLIEGDGKAVLYTGDLRCEPWFVNCLSRNPNIIQYTHGLKRLDKVYLDTSFIKNIPFQTKAQGVADLLRQVSRYPSDTIFYINSWTFGYEDVWIALSKALDSPIHVDDYKYGIYSALRAQPVGNRPSHDVHHSSIAACLVGFWCGNTSRPGCLTRDEGVRLHSCESGNMCKVAKGKSVVRIQPIVARLPSGEAMQEAGIGGGGEDLEPEVELGVASHDDLQFLLKMICGSPESSDGLRRKAMEKLKPAITSGRSISLNIRVFDDDQDSPKVLLDGLASVIQNTAGHRPQETGPEEFDQRMLPGTIRFPYSRHSPYPELCDFLDVFKPRDVWPCTVNAEEWMRNSITVQSLFAKHCSDTLFSHDQEMNSLFLETNEDARDEESHGSSCIAEASSQAGVPEASDEQVMSKPIEEREAFPDAICTAEKSKAGTVVGSQGCDGVDGFGPQTHGSDHSFASPTSLWASQQRDEAYEKMLQNVRGGTWSPIDLLSTGKGHDTEEVEL